MSAGGAFTLIANDGKADRILMATALINQRIKETMCMRDAAKKDDLTPTLYDIERTHALFVNKSFKPFVAIAYEYNKVQPQSGSTTTIGANGGQTVTFSIPQFGDFFHDMVIHVILDSYTISTALTVPAHGAATGLPVNTITGSGLITASASGSMYSTVNAFGTAIATGASYYPLCRYCEYPGNRLFTNVAFQVNGNPLDEYDDITQAFIQKFTIPPEKEYGYNRLVGQENVLDGWSAPHAATISDAEGAATTAAGGVVPVSDTFRYKLNVVDGPQTPKATQPQLEIWNKLRFWFNDDVGLSIPSASIPFGQRFLTFRLCAVTDLVFPFVNLYLKTTNIIVPVGVSGGATTTTGTWNNSFTPIDGGATMPNLTIYRLELYINNIFVNPEIHDIYIKRIGFTLIRVFRRHTIQTSQSTSDEHQLSQLKWPVEYLFLGLRPQYNVDSDNNEQWRDWHRMTKTVNGSYNNGSKLEIPLMKITASGAGTLLWPDLFTSGASYLTCSYGQIIPDMYTMEMPTINTITVTAHGIKLYDTFEDRFFNAYLPFHFGGPAIVTPKDPGALMVNFCLYPKSYQPSGHVNVSRAREFFVKWETSYVTSAFPATFYAVAMCINFLIISDGSAVLRYAT